MRFLAFIPLLPPLLLMPAQAQAVLAAPLDQGSINAAAVAAALAAYPAPYTDAQAYAQAQTAITASLSGPLNMASGTTIGGQTIASIAASAAPVQSVNGSTGVVSGLDTPSLRNAAISSSLTPYLTAATAASTYQPLGSYLTSSALTPYLTSASAASTYATLGSVVTSVAGVAPVGGNVPLSISSVGNVSGIAYFHRYSNVTLTVPAVSLGAVGTGTATVSGTAAGDQCFVAPTSATPALGYVMASGWVTTAGTVKVTLAAGTLVAISAGTIAVNMLCAQ